MKNTMIKIAAVVIAALMVFSLAACTQGAEKSVDIYALTDEMQSAVEMPAMLSIKKGDGNDKKGFAAISDMDYAKVAEFSLLYAADGTAYELAVIKLADPADMTELERSLKKHIERRALANRLLDLHIRRDLIERDMTGAFDHHLNIVLPRSFGKFS